MLPGSWRDYLGDRAETIRAVLFDAVGTLIFPVGSVADAYAKAAGCHGSTRTPEEIRGRFGAALRASQLPDLRSSEAIERERWRGIVKALVDDLPDTGALYEDLWKYFSRPEAWHLATGAEALLESLLRRGLRVGVASNFDARLYSVLEGRVPRGVEMFVSSELGWQKPALGFFREVESRLQFTSREIVLVGDDWENDIAGAHAAGWGAIWVANSPNERLPAVSCIEELVL